jgi:hypothetical protein
MYTAPQKLHTTVTVAGSDKPADQPSIRQTIIGGLKMGLSTAEIAEQVKAIAPNSAAAAKSSAHIAWYRNQLKKAGQLPSAPKVEPTADELRAQIAALQAKLAEVQG